MNSSQCAQSNERQVSTFQFICLDFEVFSGENSAQIIGWQGSALTNIEAKVF